MKTRSKYILLLFMGIIVLLLGGIFFTVQQEKEGSITAEAASVYWEIPDFCPECGAENSDINMTRTDFTRVGDGCTFTYEHKIRSGIYCTGTVTIHTGVSVAAKNPTCTSSGNTAGAKCRICGIPDPKNPVRTIAALGHNYVAEWSGSDYQSATVRFKCSRCSSKLPDEATITERTVKEATCTEQGQRIYTATLEYRGETYIDVKNESLPALGHDIENHAGKEPTCTAVGWNAYETCSRCDYTTYQEIAATGHTPGAAATCTTPQTCTECGTTLTEATGHTWDSGEVISKAGCIYDGKIKYTCTECGETKTEDIPALGHGWGETKPGQAPTCTSAGYTSYKTCIRCGYTTRETIPALGHSYGSYTQTKAPTCTEDGTETAKCIRCTSQKTRNIDALGHDLEYHAGKEPTCTSVGWNAYETCNRAGCAYTTYREIAATGHTPGAAATCTTSQTCTVCGATLVEALGHKTVSHLGQDPTCTAEGWKPYETCENCDYTTYEEIEALGHSFTSYVSDNNATCLEDGTETAKCDRCEVTDTRTDEGSALGHDWAEKWTTDGTAHWHECSRCDEINDKATHSGGAATCIALAKCEICGVEYGELAEHVYVENAEEQYLASAATCTAKATYYKSCSVCREAGDESFEYGEPLGHAYGEPEWTWEGYTSATATFTCTRGCGDKQTATASGSSITNVVTTPAECETEGLRTYTAKVMFGGEEYVTTTTETIEALGHDLEHHEAQPATCIEIGWNAYDTCTRCDYTTYVEIEALGHDWAEEWTTDGTAHWHECSRCDEINDKANHSGGEATCTNPAECEVCGAAYGDALGHTEGEAVRENEVPASCTAAGSYDEVVYCSVCGEELRREEKVIDALGHDLEHHEAKPATCTENGWDAYDTCTRCDYTTYVEIDALGHTESEAVRENEVPASCTAAGSYDEVIYCSVCGEELSREGKVIDALGHSFTSYVSDNNATCTEDGTETAKCDRCEVTDTRTNKGSALGHDWAEEWTTDGTAHWHECSRCDEINDKANHSGGEATCTNPAECEVCGAEYGESLGHDFEHHEAKPATCTEIGWEAYDTCTRCDYTTYVEIPAKGHAEGEVVRENEVPASCTTAGSYDEVIYCSVCDEELSRKEKVIDALGHSFTNYVSDNNATCTEDGTETAKCDRCEVTDTRTDEGSALGHTESEAVRENEVPASCTAAGSYDEVVYCSVCGEELSREEKVIDALGHSFTSYVSDNNATCTEDGTETAKCDRCDVTDTRTDEGSALGHDWSDEWTTNGTSHWHECSRCDEINDKATHSGGTATCVNPAECEVCGAAYGDALGHTEGEPVRENEVSASCTEVGSYDEVIYCSVCGEELSREKKVIDALGHDIIEHEGQAATCTQNGWNAYETCNRAGCGYTTYREIAATGHTPGAAATCTTPQTCTVCGATLIGALGHSFVDGYCTTCGVSDEEALENDREDAKTDLDDVAQNVKDEIDASDLPDDVKEDLKDKVDEIVNGAKDEVDGSTDFDDVSQAVEDAKEEIEDTILNAEKDDAKSDLDEIVQNAKDEIDASELPDDVKEDLKDKVDEIVNDAKAEIDSETTKEEVDAAIEDARQEIEDAILNTEKDDAKSDLDEIVQNAKDEIDASELPDDVKEDLKDKLDEIINDTKAEIDSETTKEEVEAAVEDARQEIEDALLNTEKDDAKSDLDEIVQNAKDEIDASDLSDEEKNELKGKLDEVLSSAKEEIGNATSKEEVDAIVNDVRKDIEDLLNGSSGDEISEEKEVAVSDLENTVQNAKDEIGASDLSDEEKNELKGKLDEVLSSAKEEIGFAATTEEIEEILTSVKEEIAALTENLTEGQPDASPLWPWLIAAVVISAALAAIFAWRHVKSARGKGETIGVKSVVTIAVATILIFVLVIGIVLLIFAMI